MLIEVTERGLEGDMRPTWQTFFAFFVMATAMGGLLPGKAQEGPKDIIAAQIRSQGFACDSPQSAEQDKEASAANATVWTLRCQNASYRVTLIPNLAAKVEKVEEQPPE
jgi:hypothetical protein